MQNVWVFMITQYSRDLVGSVLKKGNVELLAPVAIDFSPYIVLMCVYASTNVFVFDYIWPRFESVKTKIWLFPRFIGKNTTNTHVFHYLLETYTLYLPDISDGSRF